MATFFKQTEENNNFWKKNYVIIAIDVEAIVERVFCPCGLDNVLQVRSFGHVCQALIFHSIWFGH